MSIIVLARLCVGADQHAAEITVDPQFPEITAFFDALKLCGEWEKFEVQSDTAIHIRRKTEGTIILPWSTYTRYFDHTLDQHIEAHGRPHHEYRSHITLRETKRITKGKSARVI